MTSKATDVRVVLTMRENGVPERTEHDGTLTRQAGKALVKFDKNRVWIERGRVIVSRGYTLTLDPTRPTALDYPTPYGTLSIEVRTKKLNVTPDLQGVQAAYELWTAGRLASELEMNLQISEE